MHLAKNSHSQINCQAPSANIDFTLALYRMSELTRFLLPQFLQSSYFPTNKKINKHETFAREGHESKTKIHYVGIWNVHQKIPPKLSVQITIPPPHPFASPLYPCFLLIPHIKNHTASSLPFILLTPLFPLLPPSNPNPNFGKSPIFLQFSSIL